MRLELPLDETFMPTVNVRVMDRQMAGLHTPMLGYASIKLQGRTAESAEGCEEEVGLTVAPWIRSHIAAMKTSQPFPISAESQRRQKAQERWLTLALPYLEAERERQDIATSDACTSPTTSFGLRGLKLRGFGAAASSRGIFSSLVGRRAGDTEGDEDDRGVTIRHRDEVRRGHVDVDKTREEIEADVKNAKRRLNQIKAPDEHFSFEEQQEALAEVEKARSELDDAIERLEALSNWKSGRLRFDEVSQANIFPHAVRAWRFIFAYCCNYIVHGGRNSNTSWTTYHLRGLTYLPGRVRRDPRRGPSRWLFGYAMMMLWAKMTGSTHPRCMIRCSSHLRVLASTLCVSTS